VKSINTFLTFRSSGLLTLVNKIISNNFHDRFKKT
jgi:hypothetical protein